MSRASRLGALLYNTEASFSEISTTFGTRLQTLGPPTFDLQQPRMNIGITQQRAHEGTQDVRMVQTGTLTFELMLGGHGGTAAGSLTATHLSTLLGHVIGTSTAGQIGSTVAASPSPTTTTFTATGVNLSNGGMCRIGALNDGRGEGQFYAVSGESSDAVTLLTATGSAPATADVVYAALLVHPSETPGTFETVQSLRFRVLSANNHYDLNGCYPTAIEIPNLNVGEVPRIKLTFAVSRWDNVSATFPDTTSTDAKVGAPIAAGSISINARGTATRATYGLRDFKVTLDSQVIPIFGPGGLSTYQNIVGAKRLKCGATISCTFDAETTGTQVWEDLYETADSSLTSRHIIWTGSVADGRAIGMYFPNAKLISPRPTQVDIDGINRVPVMFEAMTDTTTTSDLTMSNFRLGLA